MAKGIAGRIKTSAEVTPYIYSYTTPTIREHDGWTKIGDTMRDPDVRIAEQGKTINVPTHKEWALRAEYEDGGMFRDYDFHAYLAKLGVERMSPDAPGSRPPEWFHIDGPTGKAYLIDFRENHGIVGTEQAVEYTLRAEQAEAVERTIDYRELHEAGEFLWNAKPRFGKTLTAYDFCRRTDARRVLIVTNRPAIANSWYDDYVKFLGTESGYVFVSETDALKGREHVLSREDFTRLDMKSAKLIEFVSLQDLKGSVYFGGTFEKLWEVANYEWDVLIIDEAHEGADTRKADVAFDHVKRDFTLHLTGTPFKQLADEKFPEDAIFNWTYADEQARKAAWDDPERENPYEDLPRLNLFTYRMSDIVAGEVEAGMDMDGGVLEYAFDLNEFFAVNERGHFVHNADVDRFLEALTTQEKFPFSTPELRDELKHTFWMLNRVNSAKALAKKLKKHHVFGEYEIVVAAGDGLLALGEDADGTCEAVDATKNARALDRVRRAIAEHDKTITLSVGQLTTGVTVPEWTAVLMLSNMRSPSLYMQAAFRAQNPCMFKEGGVWRRKENVYVFDFDPARTLGIFEQFANDLCSDTSAGKGDLDTRKLHVRRLLNFFPVLGEDDEGEMVELDAELVLSIPRKIHSTEVVRRGFMCDFLFQNISCVFRAPAEVREIIQLFPKQKEPEPVELGIDERTADRLSLNDEGEVELSDEIVIGTAIGVFGDKVYEDIEAELGEVIESIRLVREPTDEDRELEELKATFVGSVSAPLLETAQAHYDDDLKPSHRKHIERRIEADVESTANRRIDDYRIQRNKLEIERERAMELAETDEEEAALNAEYDAKIVAAFDKCKDALMGDRRALVESAGNDIVRTVETAKRESEKRSVEDGIRDHLRGFSRTIPSFLMAYGDEATTLATFDSAVPADVFEEVTGITVEQFRGLRDGFDYVDGEGETRHFDGHLFDPVVFDDSVREFLRLRRELADYFDESHDRDIFDYIPPQKTNQIYTPRRVVVQMVDIFEAENPGCFDDPAHTFADLYMKSGLYITEIVKRLYRSAGMRAAIPDDAERLRHILERQVFGIAPTRIIYEIATHYILGADGEVCPGVQANFVCADSAALAKEGKLAEFVEETFGERM